MGLDTDLSYFILPFWSRIYHIGNVPQNSLIPRHKIYSQGRVESTNTAVSVLNYDYQDFVMSICYYQYLSSYQTSFLTFIDSLISIRYTSIQFKFELFDTTLTYGILTQLTQLLL